MAAQGVGALSGKAMAFVIVVLVVGIVVLYAAFPEKACRQSAVRSFDD